MFRGEFIKSLRIENKYSQADIAKKLAVSRPTYDAIEKGESEITLSHAGILAEIYGITISELLDGKKSTPQIIIESDRKKDSNPAPILRISVPQKNQKKFNEVLLYILNKVGAKPNVGQTVLYKLLYFIDFDYYEKYEEQIMGIQYIKNHHGPTPREFKYFVDKMIQKEEITEIKNKHFGYDQKKYLPLREPDLSVLSAQEIKHIDEVLERFGDKSAKELSSISHEDVPWITAEDGHKIDYEAVFYRTSATSVRSYKED